MNIVSAFILCTTVGAVGATVLVSASKVMAVAEDPRIEEVTNCLAGANCGGCGYAGCADYAKAIDYSPYISVLNGDNRERYRETLVQLCHEIEPIYSSLKNNN